MSNDPQKNTLRNRQALELLKSFDFIENPSAGGTGKDDYMAGKKILRNVFSEKQGIMVNELVVKNGGSTRTVQQGADRVFYVKLGKDAVQNLGINIDKGATR